MRPSFEPSRLVGPTQEALEAGKRLMAWWLERQAKGSLRTFPLLQPSGPLVEMSGFFSPAKPGGAPVMGCLQRARFPLPPGNGLRGRIDEIPRRFAAQSSWKRSPRESGGFAYKPLLQKRLGEDRCEPSPPEATVDFGLEGLEWLVTRVDILDFVRTVPALAPVARLMSRIVREAAIVVVHRDFASIPDIRGEGPGCSFGYSFLPIAPEPSPFGFGPGHFGAAIKQFQFSCTPEGEFEISLAFIVSPRSEKVLNLYGFDPVYAMIDLVDRLSFRRFQVSRRLHDRLDAVMLRLHGKVHHRLLVDMEARRRRTAGK